MADSKELDLFSCEDGKPPFESYAKKNGILYWMASDFLSFLGYADYSPTMKPILRARQVMTSFDAFS